MLEVTSVRLRWRLLLAAAAAVTTMMALPVASGATMPGGNGRIAFEKFVTGGEGGVDIWSMNPDGSGAVQLTTGEDAAEGSYSPDGSRLAFGRYDEILVAGADGSNPRVISAGSTKQSTSNRWVSNYEDPKTGAIYPWVKIEEQREERDTRSEPSFSPDGTALAVPHYTGTYIVSHVCSVNAENDPSCNGAYTDFFTKCVDCGSSIEVIDAGTGAVRATLAPKTSGVYLSAPSYSPSGSVAYVRAAEGASEEQILSVASPGATPTTLASGRVDDPDYSPDGKRVAFASDNHGIGIVAVTGGAPTVFPVPPPAPSNKAWVVQKPVWSPDGSLIAFSNLGAEGAFESYTDGGVYLMRSDGSGVALIHGGAANPTSWQPLLLPPPVPPVRARAVKGKKKVRLSKKGIGVVGKVVCGSTACSPKATGAKLKIGKKRFGVKVILSKSLLPGATAKVKVKVKGKGMAALKARRGGKLKLRVLVAEGSGSQALPFAAKLLPPKKQKKKGRAGSGR